MRNGFFAGMGKGLMLERFAAFAGKRHNYCFWWLAPSKAGRHGTRIESIRYKLFVVNTLLVITPQTGFADAIRAMVDPRRFRVLHCGDQVEAEPVLARGGINACLIETDLVHLEAVRAIADLRRRFPHGPLVVIAGAKQWEMEEKAYLEGVTHILPKPVQPGLLSQLLERALEETSALGAGRPTPRPPSAPPTTAKMASAGSVEALYLLRKFASVLAHCAQADTLVREFLLMLREVLGVNRAAVYLRRPPELASTALASDAARRLQVSCVAGLPAELLRHFDLSTETGIGARLHQGGRILLRDSLEASGDEEVRKEFELAGAHVAVPILDREHLVGVALFDHRLTDEAFSPAELNLIFHLFEELGVALKMIWRQQQTVAGHERMAEIETARAGLVRLMAERLSHEVGNTLVPLSTHQQLFDTHKRDPEFIASLQTALDEGVRRTARLASQMLFLARDLPSRVEAVAWEPLLQEAFREAQHHQPESKPLLLCEQTGQVLFLRGDRLSLKHAFFEVLLNALQASPREARVRVRFGVRRDQPAHPWVDFDLMDSGSGFSREAEERAFEPFFTTRQVGLGLGLTVARKILESHEGHILIMPAAQAGGSLIRISLPLRAGLDPLSGA
jgi:signal transduction histidine kinase